MMKSIPLLCASLALSSGTASAQPAPSITGQKPNIVFILADDLGYGDVGVYYQNARRALHDRSLPCESTPHIDALAADGLQIREHYCSSPVCAPSRASLMLGVDQGHANVRDNQFDKALEDNYTLPGVLQQAGYATACIGKWGLQGIASDDAPHGWPAHPQNRGFDYYFGYISHLAGHAHYPKEDGRALYDGSKNVVADYDCCYTTDLFTARAKKWIEDQHGAHPTQPFFVYLAFDTPHAKLQYPAAPYPAGGGLTGGIQWLGQPGHMINTANGTPDSYCYPEYANATYDDDHNPATPEVPWPDVYRRYASDIRRIDDCVGDVVQLLKDLKLDDHTLVVFTSDNGPSQESYLPQNNEANFFSSFGPFDGIKRDMWEGGIQVGAIARWPGHITPGGVTQSPSAFWDWMPTFAELGGLPEPARTDGVSLVPTLLGKGFQKPSQLYFEYAFNGKTPNYPQFVPAHRGRIRRQMQALRLGDYVGVRYNILSHADPFEIYDIVTDPQEAHDLGKNPAMAQLQQQFHDAVLGMRRPDPTTPRPYDKELVPAVEPAHTSAGVSWQAAPRGIALWIAKLDDEKPGETGITDRPANSAGPASNSDILFSGYIEVPKDGPYVFSVTSDSGALLRIHDAIVVDADCGYQPGTSVAGSILLKAGEHPFRLYVRRQKSGAALSLQWSSPDFPLQAIPATAFSH